jgi:ribosome-binding protein aMBF1 (putative translation factor)
VIYLLMATWKKIKKELLRDKEVKRLYDDLEVEYKIINEVISLRSKRKLTQKEMAVKMKTSQSALSRFESGVIENPSLNFLKKMAAALGTKLSVRFVD